MTPEDGAPVTVLRGDFVFFLLSPGLVLSGLLQPGGSPMPSAPITALMSQSRCATTLFFEPCGRHSRTLTFVIMLVLISFVSARGTARPLSEGELAEVFELEEEPRFRGE